MSGRILPGRARQPRSLGWLWAALSVLGMALALGLVLLYTPARTAPAAAAAPELDQRLSQEVHNRLGQAVAEFAYVPKRYRIPTGALPNRPPETGYGASDDSGEIRRLIRDAAELMDGQDMVGWSEDTVLRPGTTVRYYYDETILVLTWQELWEGRICTWCEVKLSDASQLRRKLAGDRYGYPIQMTASELAAQDNAVAAVSGDFYEFRDCGVHVYQGALHRVSGDTADTCFFTRSGDMLLSPRGEIRSWAEAYTFLANNDIAFSLAFGPILVMDGKNVTPPQYPWGEIWDSYARAAISQVGELHYLFLAANANEEQNSRCTAWEAAELMLAHGCDMAYALDGGQTAEVLLGGALLNRPEFGYERQVSDVLCFASALPGGEATP